MLLMFKTHRRKSVWRESRCSVAPMWRLNNAHLLYTFCSKCLTMVATLNLQHLWFMSVLHFFLPSADMKHPKKPDWLDSSPPPKSQEGQEEEEEEEDEEERRVSEGRRAKRERRQSSSSATMCQVCNIQLNSSAQAQIHYRGKTHQRRLRRLAKAVNTGRNALILCSLYLHYEENIDLFHKRVTHDSKHLIKGF